MTQHTKTTEQKLISSVPTRCEEIESSSATERRDARALPEQHKVLGDIDKWLLFNRDGVNVYAVGSLSADRYLMVPENRVDLMMEAIHYLEGAYDFAWIQQQIARDRGVTIDVAALFHKLADCGLVTAAQPHSPHSEVLRHSIRLFTFNVESLFSHIRPLQALVSSSGIVVGAVLALVAVGELLTRLGEPARIRMTTPHGIEYFWLWAGILVLALIHEGFHGLAGLRYGLIPKKITVALYLGFIPFVYIRIPGIYTIPPGKRVLVWLAGMYANILMGAIAILTYPYLGMHPALAGISARLLLVNIGILIFNLSPFMATDIYFVLSTLSKRPNVRTSSYEYLKAWIKGEQTSREPWIAVYFGLSLATIAYCVVRFIQWIYALTLLAWRTDDWTAIVHRGMPLLMTIALIIVRFFGALSTGKGRNSHRWLRSPRISGSPFA